VAEDLKLENLFYEGKNINELASLFGRNQGFINSRLKKLVLK
jgi:ATP-dependent DNA helicase RecQ